MFLADTVRSQSLSTPTLHREAVEKMLACGASAAIVVTSEKGRQRVVGMLSETDLLWKGAGAPEVSGY